MPLVEIRPSKFQPKASLQAGILPASKEAFGSPALRRYWANSSFERWVRARALAHQRARPGTVRAPHKCRSLGSARANSCRKPPCRQGSSLPPRKVSAAQHSVVTGRTAVLSGRCVRAHWPTSVRVPAPRAHLINAVRWDPPEQIPAESFLGGRHPPCLQGRFRQPSTPSLLAEQQF